MQCDQVMDPMDEVREKAAFWLIEMDPAENTDDSGKQHAFEIWLAEDVRHRQVFTQMREMWSSVNLAAKEKKSYRLGAAVCLGVAGMLLSFQLPWGYWGADYKTAVGDITEFNLPDGSTATLNTHSAINVNYENGMRMIELVQGEVLVDVRKNPAGYRFIVDAGDVAAEALGTRYSVQIREDDVQVSVFESRVLVRAKEYAESQVVTEGQQVKVVQGEISQPVAIANKFPDWTSQQLVFNKTPLSEVIGRLQQYHTGLLVLSNAPEQHERRFTGLLPAGNSEVAINLLADSMGLKVNNFSPYLIWIK